MNDTEAIEMMSRCREEILTLRRQIETLAPKADAYNQLCKVLNLLPRPSQGAAPDVAWMLEKRIRELNQKNETPKEEENDQG